MNKDNLHTKIGIKRVLIAGILILSLGIIHIAATYTVFHMGYQTMSVENQNCFLFMYITTGAATGFIGSLIIFSINGLKHAETWAWRLAFFSGLFISLMGIGAVFAMKDNPFAYIILVVGLYELHSLSIYRKRLKI